MRTIQVPAVAILFIVFPNLSFAQPNPALWDINCLYVTIALHPRDYLPVDSNVLTVPRLVERVESVLQDAGVGSCADLNSPMAADVKKEFGSYSNLKIRQPDFPELRLDTDIFPMTDANQFIIRVQVSLAKKLPLSENSAYYIMADIWKNEPIMRLVSSANLPDVLTDTALEQVRAFIAAKSLAKQSDVNQISPKFIKSSVEFTTKSQKKQNIESKYVASKNSQVFHKPGCPSAQKILPENLVSYSSREEAIAVGKRPCKRCNP
jgi:hypothetical protein